MASISFGNTNSGFQVGVSNGPIHLSSERPETPPSPVSTVPFRRDPDFVDHGTILDQIHARSTTPGARIALVGLGGVGKSQLAIEYTYRIRDSSPETWVFWIHASNVTRFEQSCRDIVGRVKIPGRQRPNVNVVKLFQDWLHDERSGKWVLILDNLDDDEFLRGNPPPTGDNPSGSDQSDTAGGSSLRYFADNLKALILITSRSRRVVSRMVEDDDIILVEPMDEIHAITLFEKKLGLQEGKEDVTQLAAELEFMPLAIVQAAAYITQRAPRLSVLHYLETFQRSDREKISLLDYEGGHLRRDREAKNSILVTWQLSFDYIRQTRPSAADLLSLMSFFDRQGIPDSLLKRNRKDRPDVRITSTGNRGFVHDRSNPIEPGMVDEFEDDILVLRDYSLISVNADGKSFEMHRLVQLAMQTWLAAHKRLEMWKERFIQNLYHNFPAGIFENWARCQLLFAHVQCAVTQRPTTDTSLGEWASLLHEAASFAWTRGNLADCKKMAKMAASARKDLFGSKNDQTLDSFNMLGLAYLTGGQLRKAEELFVQVVKIRKQELRPDHLNTLASISNLASTYRDQGRWKEAEELFTQVMEARRRVLGLDNADTATSMNNLALIYGDQGRWNQAEELILQVQDIRKKVLGLEHPDTLTSIANFASIYEVQGRWKEAEELVLQVVESCKKVLGSDHPQTLVNMHNLASIYWSQGRWLEAKKLFIEVVEVREQVLGTKHPDTLTSANNLAHTYISLGNVEAASRLMTECVRLRNQRLGPNHPHAVSSASFLAKWRGIS